MVQSGLPGELCGCAMESDCNLLNVRGKMADGKTAHEKAWV